MPKLSFERKLFKRNPQETLSYIEFLIDGIPLSELLGEIHGNISKFGWGINPLLDIAKIKELRLAQGSSNENNLYSLYVCGECGDEGCGAIMFDIELLSDTVVWKGFVWSDGWPDTIEENKIRLKPIIFAKKDYETALDKLEKLVI